jgi:hypothetical protein
MTDLKATPNLRDAFGVSQGAIKTLQPHGVAVLAFRNPDHVQVELPMPLESPALAVARTTGTMIEGLFSAESGPLSHGEKSRMRRVLRDSGALW